MYTIHEGEILLKEKYGSSSEERFYVKPPGQQNIVILDDKKSKDLAHWFTRIFLPQGFPDSVSGDYVPYQIWDTAQAFCSTISGTLATQEVLRGVGVGDTTATPLAATVTWVMKDGCGHLGRILFAYSHGSYLDAYSKKWRLCADILNDLAMCIEIALPLFKNYTLLALCISTMMKAIVGIAGGATRVAMTQHHAVRGNMADVSAKDSAQETAVNLVASITALMIISVFGSSLGIFLLMITLHIAFNYFAVRAVCLKTFNEPRLLKLIDAYLKKEVITAPCEINQIEPITFLNFGPYMLDYKICGFRIILGSSIKNIVNLHPSGSHINSLKEIYDNREYILYPNTIRREMFVLFKEEACADDILSAYFHAVLLSIATSAINFVPLSVYKKCNNPRPFAEVCHTLAGAEWSRDAKEKFDACALKYEPSYELMKYINKLVMKEWRRIMYGLSELGWDVNKHLLIVDEWRICRHKLESKAIQEEGLVSSILRSSNRFLSTQQSNLGFMSMEQSKIELDAVKSQKEEFTIEPDFDSSDQSVHEREKGKSQGTGSLRLREQRQTLRDLSEQALKKGSNSTEGKEK